MEYKLVDASASKAGSGPQKKSAIDRSFFPTAQCLLLMECTQHSASAYVLINPEAKILFIYFSVPRLDNIDPKA